MAITLLHQFVSLGGLDAESIRVYTAPMFYDQQIRKQRENGDSIASLAREFSICPTSVYKALRRAGWTPYGSALGRDARTRCIRFLRQHNWGLNTIAEAFGLTVEEIGAIVEGGLTPPPAVPSVPKYTKPPKA